MSDAIIGVTLDRSGSMRNMWEEAVAGFNTFKNDQAREDGTATFIVNYFDDNHGQLYYGYDAAEIPDLSADHEIVFPRGMTALVDSASKTIKDVERWLASNPDFDGQIYVVVITDGRENASETKRSVLRELVSQKEAAGWTFVYLAANVNTEETARDYGFNIQNSMTYDGDSVAAAYTTMSTAVARSRKGHDGDLFDSSERDLTKR